MCPAPALTPQPSVHLWSQCYGYTSEQTGGRVSLSTVTSCDWQLITCSTGCCGIILSVFSASPTNNKHARACAHTHTHRIIMVWRIQQIQQIMRHIWIRSTWKNATLVNFSQNITHECLISALTLSLTFVHLWYVIFDNRVGVKYKMMLI